MKDVLNLIRYNELLKKEENLNLENKSLILENKSEFLELLSYPSKLQKWISYQNKEKYYLLISQYLDNLVSSPSFQVAFLELDQEDAEAGKILLNDIKQFQTFPIDLRAIKFGSLIQEISQLSDVAREFGPEDGISDEKFLKSIKKIYSEMLILQNQ